ncbi:MAG: L,D-transpeptidase family protein [Pseudomonadota bacterium]
MVDLEVFHVDGLWWARLQDRQWRCAIGRGGITNSKREGDGATPVGNWPLRKILFRPDKISGPSSATTDLSWETIHQDDGWCDDPSHACYNEAVKLPFVASHEELWRADDLYDIVGVLGYNDRPPIPGAGSAIFLHVASPDYGPTEGCVALAKADLLDLLRQTNGPLVVSVRPPEA